MTEAPKWDLVYEKSNRPDEDDIADYIGNRLWKELNAYLRETYGVKPEITYSCCPAQRGWNVKYKKGGKALTTLYPERGFFIALVVIGPKEETATRQLLPVLHPHIRQLYNDSQPMTMGRWLMIKVTDKIILEDVKKLIALRVEPKNEKRR